MKFWIVVLLSFVGSCSLMSADEIGQEEQVNTLRVLRVRTADHMFVFLRSRRPGVAAVKLVAVLRDNQGRRWLNIQTVPLAGVDIENAQIRIPLEGGRVTELRLTELITASAQTVFVPGE